MQLFEARETKVDDNLARPRMLLRRGLLLAAAVALLSACSVIPPQQVNDPLGLHGEELVVTFAPATSSGVSAAATLGAQSVAGSANGVFEFADLEGGLPINPGTLTNDIDFASVRLSPADETTAPETITLSDAALDIRMWQGAASYEDAAADERVQYLLAAGGPITLERVTCFGIDSSCSYTVDSDALALGTVKFSGAPLGNLMQIIFNAPSPNLGSASFSVQAVPETVAGMTLTITLDAAEGTIGF